MCEFTRLLRVKNPQNRVGQIVIKLRLRCKLAHAILVSKFNDCKERIFEIFEQNCDLVTKDKVLGTNRELMDISDLSVELSPELVCSQVIVFLNVEVFVEKQLVNLLRSFCFAASLIIFVLFGHLVVVDEVAP